MLYRGAVRSGDVIVLAFNSTVARGLPGKHYVLSHSSLSYIYRARVAVVITHSATLPEGTLLLALSEEPGPGDRYAIDVGGHLYAAVTARELFAHIHADTVILVACNVSWRSIADAFQERGGVTVYYYTCPASPEEAAALVEEILIYGRSSDECFNVTVFP